MNPFRPALQALEDADLRYVAVGGFAVVLHGHSRLTSDLDLIVDLEIQQARRTIEVLTAAGFIPTIPVDAAEFADPEVRKRWAMEKGARLFPMVHSDNPTCRLDLFLSSPIDFDELWSRSLKVQVSDFEARIAAISDLIELKRRADRPIDRADIEELERIIKVNGDEREP